MLVKFVHFLLLCVLKILKLIFSVENVRLSRTPSLFIGKLSYLSLLEIEELYWNCGLLITCKSISIQILQSERQLYQTHCRQFRVYRKWPAFSLMLIQHCLRYLTVTIVDSVHIKVLRQQNTDFITIEGPCKFENSELKVKRALLSSEQCECKFDQFYLNVNDLSRLEIVFPSRIIVNVHKLDEFKKPRTTITPFHTLRKYSDNKSKSCLQLLLQEYQRLVELNENGMWIDNRVKIKLENELGFNTISALRRQSYDVPLPNVLLHLNEIWLNAYNCNVLLRKGSLEVNEDVASFQALMAVRYNSSFKIDDFPVLGEIDIQYKAKQTAFNCTLKSVICLINLDSTPDVVSSSDSSVETTTDNEANDNKTDGHCDIFITTEITTSFTFELSCTNIKAEFQLESIKIYDLLPANQIASLSDFTVNGLYDLSSINSQGLRVHCSTLHLEVDHWKILHFLEHSLTLSNKDEIRKFHHRSALIPITFELDMLKLSSLHFDDQPFDCNEHRLEILAEMHLLRFVFKPHPSNDLLINVDKLALHASHPFSSSLLIPSIVVHRNNSLLNVTSSNTIICELHEQLISRVLAMQLFRQINNTRHSQLASSSVGNNLATVATKIHFKTSKIQVKMTTNADDVIKLFSSTVSLKYDVFKCFFDLNLEEFSMILTHCDLRLFSYLVQNCNFSMSKDDIQIYLSDNNVSCDTGLIDHIHKNVDFGKHRTSYPSLVLNIKRTVCTAFSNSENIAKLNIKCISGTVAQQKLDLIVSLLEYNSSTINLYSPYSFSISGSYLNESKHFLKLTKTEVPISMQNNLYHQQSGAIFFITVQLYDSRKLLEVNWNSIEVSHTDEYTNMNSSAHLCSHKRANHLFDDNYMTKYSTRHEILQNELYQTKNDAQFTDYLRKLDDANEFRLVGKPNSSSSVTLTDAKEVDDHMSLVRRYDCNFLLLQIVELYDSRTYFITKIKEYLYTIPITLNLICNDVTIITNWLKLHLIQIRSEISSRNVSLSLVNNLDIKYNYDDAKSKVRVVIHDAKPENVEDLLKISIHDWCAVTMKLQKSIVKVTSKLSIIGNETVCNIDVLPTFCELNLLKSSSSSIIMHSDGCSLLSDKVEIMFQECFIEIGVDSCMSLLKKLLTSIETTNLADLFDAIDFKCSIDRFVICIFCSRQNMPILSVEFDSIVIKRQADIILIDFESSGDVFDSNVNGWESIWSRAHLSFHVGVDNYFRLQCKQLKTDRVIFFTFSNRTIANLQQLANDFTCSVSKNNHRSVRILNRTLMPLMIKGRGHPNDQSWILVNPLDSKDINVHKLWTNRPYLKTCVDDELEFKLGCENIGIVNVSSQLFLSVKQLSIDQIIVDHTQLGSVIVRTPVKLINQLNYSLKISIDCEGPDDSVWTEELRSNDFLYLPTTQGILRVNSTNLFELENCQISRDSRSKSYHFIIQLDDLTDHHIFAKFETNTFDNSFDIQIVLVAPIQIDNQLPRSIEFCLQSDPNNYISGKIDSYSVHLISKINIFNEFKISTCGDILSRSGIALKKSTKPQLRLLTIPSKLDSYIAVQLIIENVDNDSLLIRIMPQTVLRCLAADSFEFKFVLNNTKEHFNAEYLPEIWTFSFESNPNNERRVLLIPSGADVYMRSKEIATFSLIDPNIKFIELEDQQKRPYKVLALSIVDNDNYQTWNINDFFIIENKSNTNFCISLQDNMEDLPANSSVTPRWPYPFTTNDFCYLHLSYKNLTKKISLHSNKRNVTYTRFVDENFSNYGNSAIFLIQSKPVMFTNQLKISIIESDDCPPYIFINRTSLPIKLRQSDQDQSLILYPDKQFGYALDHPDMLPVIQAATAYGRWNTINIDSFNEVKLGVTNCFTIGMAGALDNKVLTAMEDLLLMEHKDTENLGQLWCVDRDYCIINVKYSVLGTKMVIDVEADPNSFDPFGSYRLILNARNASRDIFQKWRFVDEHGNEQVWSNCPFLGRVVTQKMSNVGIQLDKDAPCINNVQSTVNINRTVSTNITVRRSGNQQNTQIFEVIEEYQQRKNDSCVYSLAVLIQTDIGISLVHRRSSIPIELALVMFSGLRVKGTFRIDTCHIKHITSVILITTNFEIYDQSRKPTFTTVVSCNSGMHENLRQSVGCLIRTQGSCTVNNIHITINPVEICLEEAFLLRIISFLRDVYLSRIKHQFGNRCSNSENSFVLIKGLQIEPIEILLTTRGHSKTALPRELTDLKADMRIPNIGSFANLTKASLKFSSFNLQSSSQLWEQLADNVCNRCILFFIQQIRSQLIYVLGSADCIGNPLGVVSSILTGLTGYLISGESDQLIGGISYGIADATSRLTSCLTESIDQMSLYRKNQLTNDNPIARELTSFRQLKGLVAQPYREAVEQGAMGFLSGFVKAAITGVGTPISSALNVAHGIANIVKNETIPKANIENDVFTTRPKLPATFFIYPDSNYCINPYSNSDAELQQIAYKHMDDDEYVLNAFSSNNHVFDQSETKMIVISNRRMLLLYHKNPKQFENNQKQSATSTTDFDNLNKAVSIEFSKIESIVSNRSNLILRIQFANHIRTYIFNCIDDQLSRKVHSYVLHAMQFAKHLFKYASPNKPVL
ncbi:hypothetical protein GJ496_007692 [Pomphorhynchus laevis]|nr:hypothetical protein GJ496_007692 [Pomphorhynchus laevis]